MEQFLVRLRGRRRLRKLRKVRKRKVTIK